MQIKLLQSEIKLDASALASIIEHALGKELQFAVNTVVKKGVLNQHDFQWLFL
ncbi:MAG: hypothetical protein PHN47_00415 [Clostridia bacterium]|nr:hypothetical protein [Clostridia bacterium]MDD4570943.1 hypothetical protein [Clostridia bacterium]